VSCSLTEQSFCLISFLTAFTHRGRSVNVRSHSRRPQRLRWPMRRQPPMPCLFPPSRSTRQEPRPTLFLSVRKTAAALPSEVCPLHPRRPKQLPTIGHSLLRYGAGNRPDTTMALTVTTSALTRLPRCTLQANQIICDKQHRLIFAGTSSSLSFPSPNGTAAA
jgi:hypothetical protein